MRIDGSGNNLDKKSRVEPPVNVLSVFDKLHNQTDPRRGQVDDWTLGVKV